MFTRRQQRKAPKVHMEHLDDLVAEALVAVRMNGTAIYPAVRWLTPGRLLVRNTFATWQEYNPPARVIIEERLAAAGLNCKWEGENLVLDMPRWTPPAPKIMTIQPGLFDTMPTELSEAVGKVNMGYRS